MIKKLLTIVLSVGLSVGTVFAFGGFTDQADIPEWAASSVNKMEYMGVITGYADGSFKPNNSVSRAEMATMLGRYDDQLVLSDETALIVYAHLEDLEMSSITRMVLSLAVADTSSMDEAPDVDFDCEEMDLADEINDAWTLYECTQIGTYYYANFKYSGPVPESGGETTDIDSWYGPYSGSGGSLKSFFVRG